jgi:hypothetical protein
MSGILDRPVKPGDDGCDSNVKQRRFYLSHSSAFSPLIPREVCHQIPAL